MRRRDLRFEQLEQRVLLAGDVTVSVNRSGDLIVTGDENANQIEIVFTDDAKYRVTGLGDTKVNDQDVWENEIPVRRNIVVDLKNGDNEVAMKSDNGLGFLVPRDLTIRGGSGGDRVTVQDADIRGKLAVNTGAGDDTVTIEGGSVAGDASILTGDGDDKVAIDETGFSRKLMVNTGNGNDSVGIVGSKIGNNVSILTGEGADAVGLMNVATPGNIVINAGNNIAPQGENAADSVDRIGVAGGSAKNLTLDGGDSGRARRGAPSVGGPSEIGVTGIVISGNLTIKTGHGDDLVAVGHNEQLMGEIGQRISANLPNADPIALDDAAGPVNVTGKVSITTGNGDDNVWIEALDFNGGLTVNTGDGDDRVGVVDSNGLGSKSNISISTVNGNDAVGMVRVKTPGNVAVNAGNSAGVGDRIGLAGVEARNVSLDGGDSGRSGAFGPSTVGVTGGILGGNLTIKTGGGNDLVAVGHDDQLIDKVEDVMAELLPEGATFSLEDASGRVVVAGNVSVATGNGTEDKVWINGLDFTGGLTVNTGNGHDQVGVVDSQGLGSKSNIRISTGNGNDAVGMVRVTTPGDITVNVGNSVGSEPRYGDGIALAGITAKNVTLDGGDARNRTPGMSAIGVTGSNVSGNLTIKTGTGPDQVAVGDDSAKDAGEENGEVSGEASDNGDDNGGSDDPAPEDGPLIAALKEFLVNPEGEPIDLDGAIGPVNVPNGTLSIHTGSYAGTGRDDTVLVNELHARVFRLDTGPADDVAAIYGNVRVDHEVRINMGNDNDWLTLAVDALDDLPLRALIDGGKGTDTLENPYGLSHPLPPQLAAIFKNWSQFVPMQEVEEETEGG
jgi:hypothetical protein